MTIELNKTQIKDVREYCKLNDIVDLDFFIRSCFIQGYNIKKYGLLGGDSEKPGEAPIETVKQIVIEVPVEVEKVVEKIVEVPVEKIVYIYDKKEEDVVTNIVNNCDKMEEIIFQKEQEILEINQKFSTKMEEQSNNFQKEKNELLLKIQQFENQEGQGNKEKMLQQTLVNLKKELTLSSEKIKELETINEQLKTQQPIGAVYMKSSNLNEK
jgi:hypothetical protein